MSGSKKGQKISKRTVDALQVGDAILWDTSLPGFGVRCRSSGKYYHLKYRFKGEQRWFAIGRHSEALTPEAARRKALWVLNEVMEGRDPQLERDAERRDPTLRQFAERYLNEHAREKLKPRSVADIEWLLNKAILPKLGSKRLNGISRQDVAAWHHGERHRPVSANRALAILRHMLNTAERWGVRPEDSRNPCQFIDKFPEQKRQRYLSMEETKRLGAVLKAADDLGTDLPSATRAIRLLILTGCRLSEILTLRWEYIDWERSCIRFPDSKTGAKITPFGAAARELLAACRRETGWVCPGLVPNAPLVNVNKAWHRLRKLAGIEDVTCHDLRHSFASVGAAAGMSLPIIGALLGHSQPATTARYAHLATDPLVAAADKISGQISAAMEGRLGNMVKMKERRRG